MISKFARLTLILLASPLYLSSCGDQEKAPEKEVVRPVKMITIETVDHIQEIKLPAVIQASSSVDLTFKVSGQLIEFPISSSQDITEGDLIGKLDTRSYENEVTSAQTDFDSAKQDFDRAVTLLAQDAIAQKVHDQREATFKVAKARLDNAKKALEDTVLRAPFDGIISRKHVSRLDNVQALQEIATIQTIGAAEASVQLPASLMANSNNIEILESFVILDAAPGLKMPTKFVSASTEADPQTQTFKATYGFTPPESLVILPGMTGSIEAKITDKEAATARQIRVPIAAISAEGEKTFVWIIQKDSMTAERREITVGESLGQEVLVTSGLQVGETVAGAGGQYLHEGMKVSEFKN